MHRRILVAGAGGQGAILIGRILAAAAVRDIPYIALLPSYGAEVRGGTSHCQLVLSSEEIASPMSDQFDSMILINQASVDRFLSRMAPGAVAVVNSGMAEVPNLAGVIPVRATQIAQELGDTRAANFILLGALLAKDPLVPPSAIEREIAARLRQKSGDAANLNIAAFRLGMKSVPAATPPPARSLRHGATTPAPSGTKSR